MMRILLLVLIYSVCFFKVLGQNRHEQIVLTDPVDSIPIYKNAISLQLYKHILGIDYERTIYRNFGMAVSAGFSGAELEAKFHFKPQIKSSSIGFSTGYYWFLGSPDYKPVRINMFFFEYHAKKRLTLMAGAGWSDFKNEIKARFRGGVGIYLPW